MKANNYKLKFFLPHVLGSLLIANGLLHIYLSTLLYLGRDLDFLNTLEGFSYWKISIRYGGAISGLALAVWQFFNGIGIYRRKKRAVYSTILLIFLSSLKYMVFNLMPQIVFLNAFFLFFLIISWKCFVDDNPHKLRNYQELVAYSTVVIALVYGVAGSYFMRESYVGISSWIDAFYYTIITYSTVGYGDIIPKTTEAKLFTISMVLIGLGSFATTMSLIIGPKLENKVKGIFHIMTNLANMKDHIILCGFTELSKAIVKQLKAIDVSYVIIDNVMGSSINLSEEENYVIFKGLVSSVETFGAVNLKKAKAVITAFDNDAENIVASLTVKEALESVKSSDKIKLIVRIERESNIKKVEKIGADEIISPSTMAAKSIIGAL